MKSLMICTPQYWGDDTEVERLACRRVSVINRGIWGQREGRRLLVRSQRRRNGNNKIDIKKYEGNSISKLQIQVATYVFELSAGNCHR
jgi:hypothetical protein